MTSTEPRRVVDLDALADHLGDLLSEPTYVLDAGEVGTDDGFARFEASTVERALTSCTVRATVTLVSDGEDAIADATGDTIEIVVRRVTR